MENGDPVDLVGFWSSGEAAHEAVHGFAYELSHPGFIQLNVVFDLL